MDNLSIGQTSFNNVYAENGEFSRLYVNCAVYPWWNVAGYGDTQIAFTQFDNFNYFIFPSGAKVCDSFMILCNLFDFVDNKCYAASMTGKNSNYFSCTYYVKMCPALQSGECTDVLFFLSGNSSVIGKWSNSCNEIFSDNVVLTLPVF